MSTQAQINANQANAKLSTGPTSATGKAVSSQNNFRHGLCGPFILHPWESEEDYLILERELAAEHRPATQTERMLLQTMVESYWMRERAIQLQDMCFRPDVPMVDQPQQLALYLRYQSTHDRAFYKALAELQKLRAQKRNEAIGFESQSRKDEDQARKQLDEKRKRETHQRRIAILDLKIQGEQTRNTVHESRVASPVEEQTSLPHLKTAA